MDQKVYSCCHNFLTVTQSYKDKNTPIKKFHAVKIAKSVFFYVFTMAFPMSPIGHMTINDQQKKLETEDLQRAIVPNAIR